MITFPYQIDDGIARGLALKDAKKWARLANQIYDSAQQQGQSAEACHGQAIQYADFQLGVTSGD